MHLERFYSVIHVIVTFIPHLHDPGVWPFLLNVEGNVCGGVTRHESICPYTTPEPEPEPEGPPKVQRHQNTLGTTSW